MQNQNQTPERKTLSSVAGQKALATLEKTSAAKILIFSATAYAIARPESAVQLMASALAANSYFLVKLIAAGVVIGKWRPLACAVRRFYRFTREKLRRRENTELLEGVPVYEILHQLFYGGSFKREEVIRKWGIPQQRFDALAKKLEALGVLARGENNARVLNAEFTREEVAKILSEAGGSAKGISGPLSIFHFGRKLTPSAAEVKEKVSVAIQQTEPSVDCEIPIRFCNRPTPYFGEVLNLRNIEKAL